MTIIWRGWWWYDEDGNDDGAGKDGDVDIDGDDDGVGDGDSDDNDDDCDADDGVLNKTQPMMMGFGTGLNNHYYHHIFASDQIDSQIDAIW